ncbi:MULTISPECIES: toxin-antitoxin system antitoxin subunit [Gordonibacter]|uniref:Toxin-antitoxin system antitoxin subunit n=1 Tax=Gordonibacter faecis TaxID=3047475 RepID=A0ABT7DRE5_9ACTN|nr:MULTISPECIES: toxin-antitoxin system antitoxin subunit [unclassified Gordonibacter]MDJ1650750.1 toxin-antitoxin system antitoxin subunit [Gordonibacter sp. KGMB12511]HIW77218.1 toxin-antitoxin system antitoxin subunit [Candidatus Gordonibacter avicola]
MSNDVHNKFGITAEELDERAAEYESENWSHMEFGEIVKGRPKLYDEKMDTIVVKVPHSRVVAMKRVTSQQGGTRSDFVRRAIDNELIASN